MSLCLWNHTVPNVQILACPPIWALGEDVVRHDVIVSKGRYDGDAEGICGCIMPICPSKDLGKLGHKKFVLFYYLLLRSRYFLIVVVSSRIARPHDKIYVVGDVVLDPFECLIHQGIRAIASRCFCPVEACRPVFAMAGCSAFGARVRLVEGVWMEVYMLVLVLSW